MAYLKFARGLYNKYTPDGLDRDKIYFSTDTKQILVNGISYGVSQDDISSLVNQVEGSFKSVEYTSPNILTFTTNNGVIKTVTLVEATQTSAGLMSQTDKLALDDATSKLAKIGVANGIASLDDSGKVPSTQLPSYVDDVVEVDNLAALPTTGQSGIIYVTKDTYIIYRWSGTSYVEISKSITLGETSTTAYAGDKGALNRSDINELKQQILLKQNSLVAGTNIIITDSTISACPSIKDLGTVPTSAGAENAAATYAIAGNADIRLIIYKTTDSNGYYTYIQQTQTATGCYQEIKLRSTIKRRILNLNRQTQEVSINTNWYDLGFKSFSYSNGTVTVVIDNVTKQITVPTATSSANGLLASTDKSKLDLLKFSSDNKLDTTILPSYVDDVAAFNYMSTVTEITGVNTDFISTTSTPDSVNDEIIFFVQGSKFTYSDSNIYTLQKPAFILKKYISDGVYKYYANWNKGDIVVTGTSVSYSAYTIEESSHYNNIQQNIFYGPILNKIYLNLQTNKSYRYSSSSTTLTEISQSIIVEDILTSTSTANALSANMGNQLNTTKQNKIPVVNQTSTTVTIQPNTYNLWNSPVTSLNISLGLITETSYVNEFLFEFTAATGFTGLTLPSTVYYSGNTAVKEGGSYQVSILNNVAIIAGVV